MTDVMCLALWVDAGDVYIENEGRCFSLRERRASRNDMRRSVRIWRCVVMGDRDAFSRDA